VNLFNLVRVGAFRVLSRMDHYLSNLVDSIRGQDEASWANGDLQFGGVFHQAEADG